MGSTTDPTSIVVLAITSTISIVCSGWVIARAKSKLDQPYQRLLLIMSVLDVITSLRCATLLHVAGDEPSVLCTIDGFFAASFNLLAAIYPACLQLYFLLMVRFGVTQQRYQQWYEPVLLLLPFGYCLVVSIGGIALDMYNPSVTTTPGCFVNEYPAGCADSPDTDCERGQNADFYSLLLVAPVVLGWLCIIVCNILIYLRFRQLGQKLRRYDGVGVDVNARQGDKKLRKVAKQALQYILVFLLTYLLGLINYLAVLFLPDFESYALDLSALVFTCSQGTFTFVVYILPRYERWRNEGGASVWRAIQKTLRDEQPPMGGRKSAANATTNTRKTTNQSSDHSGWVQSALMRSGILAADRSEVLPIEEREEGVLPATEPEDESREQSAVEAPLASRSKNISTEQEDTQQA